MSILGTHCSAAGPAQLVLLAALQPAATQQLQASFESFTASLEPTAVPQMALSCKA